VDKTIGFCGWNLGVSASHWDYSSVPFDAIQCSMFGMKVNLGTGTNVRDNFLFYFFKEKSECGNS